MKTLVTLLLTVAVLTGQVSVAADQGASGCGDFYVNSVSMKQAMYENYSVFKEGSEVMGVYTPQAYDDMGYDGIAKWGSLVWVWGWSIAAPFVPVMLEGIGLAKASGRKSRLKDELYVSKTMADLMSYHPDRHLAALRSLWVEVEKSESIELTVNNDDLIPYINDVERKQFLKEVTPILLEAKRNPNFFCEMNKRDLALSSKGKAMVDKYANGNFYAFMNLVNKDRELWNTFWNDMSNFEYRTAQFSGITKEQLLEKAKYLMSQAQ